MSPQGGISSSFQMRDKCCRERAARRVGGGPWQAGRRAGDDGGDGGEGGKIGRE